MSVSDDGYLEMISRLEVFKEKWPLNFAPSLLTLFFYEFEDKVNAENEIQVASYCSSENTKTDKTWTSKKKRLNMKIPKSTAKNVKRKTIGIVSKTSFTLTKPLGDVYFKKNGNVLGMETKKTISLKSSYGSKVGASNNVRIYRKRSGIEEEVLNLHVCCGAMAKKKSMHSYMKRQKNWFFEPQSCVLRFTVSCCSDQLLLS